MDLNSASDKNRVENQVSSIDCGIAGAISGFIARALLQPLDVLKIRFQLQVEPTFGKGVGLYHGIFQATKTICKQEGIFALWKGHIPAQALTVTYGAGQFWGFAFFKKQAYQMGYGESGAVLSICGGLGGVVATLISMPLDVIRTRVVAQSTLEYKGVLDTGKKMFAQEGFSSLWKGLCPTLAMTIPFAAIQFRMYYFLTSLISPKTEETNLQYIGVTIPAFCGVTAGVCAKIVVYPLDVLKKRMQMTGSEHVREKFGKVVVYKNSFDCIRKVTMDEGLIGWFKGLKPSLIKVAAVSGVIFASYEALCFTILQLRMTAKGYR